MTSPRSCAKPVGPPAWVIVLQPWHKGWNWTLYRGGRCADEGWRMTKREALGAAREAIEPLSLEFVAAVEKVRRKR